MGEVKEAVKGDKKFSPKLTEGNLVERISSIEEEISELTTKKDADVLAEGESAKAENIRKAAQLRAAASLIRSAKRCLEDY